MSLAFYEQLGHDITGCTVVATSEIGLVEPKAVQLNAKHANR